MCWIANFNPGERTTKRSWEDLDRICLSGIQSTVGATRTIFPLCTLGEPARQEFYSVKPCCCLLLRVLRGISGTCRLRLGLGNHVRTNCGTRPNSDNHRGPRDYCNRSRKCSNLDDWCHAEWLYAYVKYLGVQLDAYVSRRILGSGGTGISQTGKGTYTVPFGHDTNPELGMAV